MSLRRIALSTATAAALAITGASGVTLIPLVNRYAIEAPSPSIPRLRSPANRHKPKGNPKGWKGRNGIPKGYAGGANLSGIRAGAQRKMRSCLA